MSEQYVAAIDQGTTSTRCMIFNRDGRVVNVDQKEHEQIFPRAGWVEHNATEIWNNTREVVAGALGEGRPQRRGHRRRRHHQPARDGAGVGQDHRRAGVQRDRLAGHPHRRHLQAARRPGRRRRAVQGQGRAAAGHLLLGPEGAVDPRQRRRRQGEGAGRRPGVRQHGHLGALEHDRRCRRRPAHHGTDERLPHHAHGPRLPVAGTRASRTRWASRCRCCRRSGRRSQVYGEVRERGHAARRADRRHLGDQQAATFGQACLSVGRGQEHLRHRQLHADQHRHAEGAEQERPAHHGLLQDR